MKYRRCACHTASRWEKAAYFKVHKVLRLPGLPRNLRIKVHKSCPCHKHPHFKAHKMLRLPRNLHFEIHKALRLPRYLRIKILMAQPCQIQQQDAHAGSARSFLRFLKNWPRHDSLHLHVRSHAAKTTAACPSRWVVVKVLPRGDAATAKTQREVSLAPASLPRKAPAKPPSPKMRAARNSRMHPLAPARFCEPSQWKGHFEDLEVNECTVNSSQLAGLFRCTSDQKPGLNPYRENPQCNHTVWIKHTSTGNSDTAKVKNCQRFPHHIVNCPRADPQCAMCFSRSSRSQSWVLQQ